MTATKRTTANLPISLLKDATEITGKGITETLIEGLRLIKRTRALEKAQKLHGKIFLDIDLGVSRERSNR